MFSRVLSKIDFSSSETREVNFGQDEQGGGPIGGGGRSMPSPKNDGAERGRGAGTTVEVVVGL